MDIGTQALLATGIGATLTMDLVSLARRWLFATPPPDYALIGRWIAHLAHGRFRHPAIAAAASVRGERLLGWLTHYVTGIGFAGLLGVTFGERWFERPTVGPALATGLITVLAPFLVMQPAMGAGVFACRTPRPGAARLQSLLNHTTFGFGLYLAALLFSSYR